MKKFENVNHPVASQIITWCIYIFKEHGPDCLLAEHGLTVSDIKKDVSDQAQAHERLNSPNWLEWCQWFRLTSQEQSKIVKFARSQAKALTRKKLASLEATH